MRTRKKDIGLNELNISLTGSNNAELFKWFLACLLFGKPIQQQVAKKAYFEFVKAGLTTPDTILAAGRNTLVDVLDRAHYVRYDFSTATKLQEVCTQLKIAYGSVKDLISQAKNSADLERRLLAFKGVGPITAKLFISKLPRKSAA